MQWTMIHYNMIILYKQNKGRNLIQNISTSVSYMTMRGNNCIWFIHYLSLFMYTWGGHPSLKNEQKNIREQRRY